MLVSWKPNEFFECHQGSRVWPSNDPNDSPYDSFICLKCGYTFDMLMGGSFPIDYNPHEEAEKKMLGHIQQFHLVADIEGAL